MSSPTRSQWLALPFISMGVAMIIVDATIVNVAIPTIIREIHLSVTGAEWLNSIYSLVFAALLISVGRAGDRWGRKRMFLVGTLVFVCSSLLAALAPNGELLIFARSLQGVGGAMILPSTLSTVNAMFTGSARAIAFAVWGSTIGGFAAVGPLLGGWLTTDVSWRWAFLVNVPLGILILVGILFFIEETSDPAAHSGFDIPGNILTVLGLGGVVFALIESAQYGWWTQEHTFAFFGWHWPTSWISIIPFIFTAGVLLLLLFIGVELSRRNRERAVLIDFALFRIRSFGFGNVAAFTVSLGEFGLLFVLPLFLQGVLRYSALGTGFVFLALAIGAFIAGGLTPVLTKSLSPRNIARLGLLLEAVGLGLLGLMLSVSSTGWGLSPWLFIYGLGVGMASAQLTGVILTDVPTADSGQASGIQSTARQVGSAFGVAILGTVFLTILANRSTTGLSQLHALPPAAIRGIVALVKATGGAGIPSLGSYPGSAPIIAAASQAVTEAAKFDAFLAGGFILIGLVATFALPRVQHARAHSTHNQ
ncbi:MAG: DHA2 family efflux MFS transporter permease subunit [Candidatus Dormibacteria bacterium]